MTRAKRYSEVDSVLPADPAAPSKRNTSMLADGNSVRPDRELASVVTDARTASRGILIWPDAEWLTATGRRASELAQVERWSSVQSDSRPQGRCAASLAWPPASCTPHDRGRHVVDPVAQDHPG